MNSELIRKKINIGVLGFQGAIQPHLDILTRLNVTSSRITSAEQLETLSALILPGGESTTMLNLIHSNQMWQPLIDFCSRKPCWGVCAGAILLAAEVEHPNQESLGLIGIKATRNAYGSQLDSFKGEVILELTDQPLKSINADFIRAPRLTCLSKSARPFAFHQQRPVGFIEDKKIATSFHIELVPDSSIHELLISWCQE